METKTKIPKNHVAFYCSPKSSVHHLSRQTDHDMVVLIHRDNIIISEKKAGKKIFIELWYLHDNYWSPNIEENFCMVAFGNTPSKIFKDCIMRVPIVIKRNKKGEFPVCKKNYIEDVDAWDAYILYHGEILEQHFEFIKNIVKPVLI